ncbi:ureohydrolase [Lucifera butyrica]|uniref:Arginase n=1 Tax=Lucifera butyrica TaxID=1351585 RepID=A0A498R6L5_9FIRM|nr:arginase [Lucifera butyrica]VBB07001.1 ureohydrolase [Lucifera butyrica]
MKTGISIIGAPVWLGQTHYGTNLGPYALRAAGILDALTLLTADVIDAGNIAADTKKRSKQRRSRLKNLRAVVTANEELAEMVSLATGRHRFPLVLGGDHSIAIGTLAGLARHYHNLGVIWYDAHADMNTPETSPSGNIHGMPLAASMGLGHPSLVQVAGYMPKVKPENIVFIGIRDIDPGERELIRTQKIKQFTVADINERGMPQIIRETLDYLLSRCDGIHLSFDLDGIDPSAAPGVGTPVPGGISWADSLLAMQELAHSGQITSAEFVELNPLLDKDQRTTQATVRLVSLLFGGSAVTAARQELPAATDITG